MRKLKSCPFCAGEVDLDTDRLGNPFFIECAQCGLGMGGDSKKEIIQKWNRRSGDRYVKTAHGPYDEIYEEGVKSLT